MNLIFFNGSQLATMKKYISHMSHEIYREAAVGLKKKLQLYLKKWDFCNKCEILDGFVNNCLSKVRIHFFLSICDTLISLLFSSFLLDRYIQLNTDFPSKCCVFYRKITQHYSKNGLSRKCFEKQNKTRQKQQQKPVFFFFICFNYRLK